MSKMAEGILIWNELRELIETAVDLTLLIDCRPFLAYNSGHISSAHNIHCPPIVKRRAGGCLPLENIVRCSEARSKLSEGRYKFVVIYDENTHCIDHLPADANMCLVLKSLRDSAARSNIYFLQGGYDQFRVSCPEMCICSASTESESSDVPCEWFTPHTSKIPSDDLNKHPKSTWDHESSETVTMTSSSNNSLRDTVKYRPSDDQGDPEAILPWLFLGSAYHAMQESRLRGMGINALLNMASKSDTLTPSPSFLHKRVSVEDSCTTDISFWFPEVIDFIESVRQRGGKVLVHCHAGISRSATVCIAYIMWYRHWSMEKAYSFLKSKRSLIAPNLNFMRQLHEFEAQLEDNGKRLKFEGSPASSNSCHSSSSSYLSSFSNCESASPRDQPMVFQGGSADAAIQGSQRFIFESSPSHAALKSLSLGGAERGGGRGFMVSPKGSLDHEFFVLPPNNTSTPGSTIASFVASISQPSPHQVSTNPQSLSANLLSSGLCSQTVASQHMKSHPASAKPVFNLPLTPCTRQANVFSFDSPVTSPLTQHTNSPTLSVCHSPLVSPS